MRNFMAEPNIKKTFFASRTPKNLPKPRLAKIVKDNNDRHILALCKKIGADYLITFDRKHLIPIKNFGQTKILEPKDFIDYLKND